MRVRRRWLAAIAVVCIGGGVTGARAQVAGFDVVSVRENKSEGPAYSNFPLNPGAQYDVQGGLLTARRTPLLQFMVFAFKMNMHQIQSFRAQLPDWARSARFDIQARAEGDPSKDQMRAMMLGVLEERFAMRTHVDVKQVPVFEMRLVKAGKPGPRLRPHVETDGACDRQPPPYNRAPGEENVPIATTRDGYPAYCGAAVMMPGGPPGRTRVGGRGVSMADIALALGGVSDGKMRPFEDKTGLAGLYDFTLEFTPEASEAAPETLPFDAGPDLRTAVREQLGVRLEPGTGPLTTIVLDHLERPGEN